MLAAGTLILMGSAAQLAAQEPTLSANNYAVDEPMPARAAALQWADEFDGRSLDMSKWRYDTVRNKAGWHNNELQYYSANRPRNLRLEGGRLIIEARKDPQAIRGFADWGGQKYSSARILTKGKASFRYGFVEARAKVPCGRGTWPAIWMLPDAATKWPEGGEIDILEHIGVQPNVLHGNLHTGLFNHVKQTGRGAQKSLPTACSAFHNYQLHWTPDAITIGVDDRAYMRVRNDQPGGVGAWPFDQPFHLIVNLAIGGDWAGTKGIDDAALPEQFEVDYIRVWQEPAPGERG